MYRYCVSSVYIHIYILRVYIIHNMITYTPTFSVYVIVYCVHVTCMYASMYIIVRHAYVKYMLSAYIDIQ